MDFNKLSLREIIILSIAGLVMVWTILAKIVSHGSSLEQDAPISPVESNHLMPVVETINNSRPMKGLTEEDTQSIKEMKEQMESDRLQQKKIKMLKLQLEQTNLQLEQEKALSEISKLQRENTSVVSDSSDQGQDKYPDVRVIYIGGTAEEKQAILAINGNNYSVKEKNKPVKNVEVMSITDSAVMVHYSLPQSLNITVEYKPE